VNASSEPLVIRRLPCSLTEEEIAQAAMICARLDSQYDDTEAEKKTLVSEMTAKLKELRASMTAESRKATTGIEEREVECEYKIERASGFAELFRTDTGEVVERRRLTPAELQLSMDSIVQALMDREQSDGGDE
jgi:hypothetical protein